MKTKKDTVALIFFLTAGAALLAFVLLAVVGVRWFESRVQYELLVDDVGGLVEGASVRMRGVTVGEVERVVLFPEAHPDQVQVILSVRDDTPVPKGAVATLEYKGVGVSGERLVSLSGGRPQDGAVAPGSRLPVKPAALDQLQDRITSVATTAESLLTETATAVAAMRRIVEAVERRNPERVIDLAASAVDDIGATARLTRQMVQENRRDIRGAVQQLEGAAGEAKGAFSAVQKAAEDADALVVEAKSVVERNDAHLAGTIDNLRQASRELETFGRRIRTDPSQLLLSSQPEPRRLP